MFTMNFYAFVILVSLCAMCALSAPTNEEVISVYDKLVELAKDDKYKCPQMRNSLLLTPEPEFLKYCLIPVSAMDSKEFNPILTLFTLCMVYFESFKRMCALAPTMKPEESTSLLSDSLLNSTLPLETICNTMKNSKPVDLEYKLAFDVMNDDNKCRELCLGSNDHTIPICEWSAYLLQMAAEYERKHVLNKKPVLTEQTTKVDHKDVPAKANTPTVELEKTNLEQTNSALHVDTDAPNIESAKSNSTVPQVNEAFNVKVMPNQQAPQVDAGSEVNANSETSTKNTIKIDKSEIKTPTPTTTAVATVKPKMKVYEVPEEEAVVDAVEVPSEGIMPSSEPDAGEKTEISAQNTDVEQNIDLDDKEDGKKANNNHYDEDEEDDAEYSVVENVKTKSPEEKSKPLELEDDKMGFPGSYSGQNIEEDDSYFFSYFMMICIVFILGYVGYHNKQKILAIVLEGRKGKRQQRRRPNSANYHKLDSNLEEAVTSSCNKNTANVIY